MPAVIFDSKFKHWTNNPEKNLIYLKRIQSLCNDILKEKGYLFLSEVFEMLEYDDRTYNEFSYGWWIEDGQYDIPWEVENFVSFGLYDYENARNREFINCKTPIAYLNFNTTGDIGQYLLDKAIIRNGIELAQDYFDYPNLYLKEIDWSDYI